LLDQKLEDESGTFDTAPDVEGEETVAKGIQLVREREEMLSAALAGVEVKRRALNAVEAQVHATLGEALKSAKRKRTRAQTAQKARWAKARYIRNMRNQTKQRELFLQHCKDLKVELLLTHQSIEDWGVCRVKDCRKTFMLEASKKCAACDDGSGGLAVLAYASPGTGRDIPRPIRFVGSDDELEEGIAELCGDTHDRADAGRLPIGTLLASVYRRHFERRGRR
jgi:hypothetical protein